MKIIDYKPVIDEVRKFHIKFLSIKWLHTSLVFILHDMPFNNKFLGDILADMFIHFLQYCHNLKFYTQDTNVVET